jgi:hypothetical protein
MNAPAPGMRPTTLLDELRDGALTDHLRHGETLEDLLERAARALELARELFVTAATSREQTAESRAHGALTIATARGARLAPYERALERATGRVETRRREAIELFNKATGIVK